MPEDLNKLVDQIDALLAKQKCVVFRGRGRWNSDSEYVVWDEDRNPDVKDFLKVAAELGVSLLVFHQRELDEGTLEQMKEDIDLLPGSAAERRDLEKRMKFLYDYLGRTMVIELSFDVNGCTYMYRQQSPVMTKMVDLIDEIEMASGPFAPPSEFDEDDEDEDDGPPQRYFSKN
jgi:hypothetical protein